MNIAWSYLDKRRAAVAALKDYDNMSFIISNTGDELKRAYECAVGLGAQNMDGMPHGSEPKAGEKRLVNSIDEIDVITERYRKAKDYMAWFCPAWAQLSDDEQYVLETFYREQHETNIINVIADHLHVERSSAYNRKNRALERLTTLLFGGQ